MEKRRGGWPARTYEPGERVPLSCRITPEMKAKLDNSAQYNGRSLAQEVELRLAQSFENDRFLEGAFDLVFGRALGGLLLILGRTMQASGMQTALEATRSYDAAQTWLEDSRAFGQAAEAAMALLDGFRPQKDDAESSIPVAGAHLPAVQKLIVAKSTRGKRYAAEVLRMLKKNGEPVIAKPIGSEDWQPVNLELWDFVRRAGAMLGDLVEQIEVPDGNPARSEGA
jgi:hypothetical protein